MSHSSYTPIALTGIHTDVGKTICAAVLVRALQCDYWKPIQAGGLDNSDSDTVRCWNETAHIHPEAYRLQLAASPHTAARAEQVTIALTDLHAPLTDRPLLIETAGGVCSPVNEQHVVADLLAHYRWPTILVTQHYLGSISHTLSAIDALNARGVAILGLLINGDADDSSEQFITQYSGLPILAHIERMTELSESAMAQQAQRIAPNLTVLRQHWTW